MRAQVSCPSCSTQYALDTKLLSSDKGGSVQCSKCGHIWFFPLVATTGGGSISPSNDLNDNIKVIAARLQHIEEDLQHIEDDINYHHTESASKKTSRSKRSSKKKANQASSAKKKAADNAKKAGGKNKKAQGKNQMFKKLSQAYKAHEEAGSNVPEEILHTQEELEELETRMESLESSQAEMEELELRINSLETRMESLEADELNFYPADSKLKDTVNRDHYEDEVLGVGNQEVPHHPSLEEVIEESKEAAHSSNKRTQQQENRNEPANVLIKASDWNKQPAMPAPKSVEPKQEQEDQEEQEEESQEEQDAQEEEDNAEAFIDTLMEPSEDKAPSVVAQEKAEVKPPPAVVAPAKEEVVEEKKKEPSPVVEEEEDEEVSSLSEIFSTSEENKTEEEKKDEGKAAEGKDVKASPSATDNGMASPAHTAASHPSHAAMTRTHKADEKNPFLILDARVKRINQGMPVERRKGSSPIVLLLTFIIFCGLYLVAFVNFAPRMAETYLPAIVIQYVQQILHHLGKL